MSAEGAIPTRLRQACAALLLACSLGSEARGEDLLDIYRTAQQMDPILMEAVQGHRAALARVDQAKAAFRPQATLSASVGDTKGRFSYDLDESERRSKSTNWKLQVTQQIFRLTDARAHDVAEAQAQQAAARLEQAERELSLRVTKAYLDLELVNRTAGLIQVQLQAYEEQQRQAEQGLVQGTHSLVDVLESRSRVEATRAQRIAALNDVKTRRSELARVIGTVPARLQGLRDDATAALPAGDDLKTWTQRARQVSPQAREKQAALDAAQAELARSRAEHLPRLELVGAVSGASQSQNTASVLNFSSRSATTELLLQAVVPIFSGGGMSARVRETQAAVLQAHAQQEATLREIDSLVEQAYLGLSSAQAEVQALRAAQEAARHALTANQAGLRFGVRALADVLNAQQQLHQVERDLLKARHAVLLSAVRFALATEPFGEDTMRVFNNWFANDPAP